MLHHPRKFVETLIAALASAGPIACSPGLTLVDAGGKDTGVAKESGGGGAIVVSQSHRDTRYSYLVHAGFTTLRDTPRCATTNVGGCSVSTCSLPLKMDGGALGSVSTLNAGTISVVTAGGDAGAAMLVYGPVPREMVSDYAPVEGMSQFFVGGDLVTAVGSGGADLPPFATQSVAAPHDITITAPACTLTGCPPLDRTTDLPVAWMGGQANGKVTATFNSISDAKLILVSCDFDAARGVGTVPALALSKLEKAGDPGISGVLTIRPTNETTFMVGTLPTTFSVTGEGKQAGLTISN